MIQAYQYAWAYLWVLTEASAFYPRSQRQACPPEVGDSCQDYHQKNRKILIRFSSFNLKLLEGKLIRHFGLKVTVPILC
jgi:hypothetical protein